ncbi:MAG: hypothetical protein ACI4QM_03935, partial [Alphaproteobacteria bacterium]
IFTDKLLTRTQEETFILHENDNYFSVLTESAFNRAFAFIMHNLSQKAVRLYTKPFDDFIFQITANH